MSTTLTRLRGLVQTYAGNDFSGILHQELDDLKYHIEEMVQTIIWEINDDFNIFVEQDLKHRYIKSLVSELTFVSDSVVSFDKDKVTTSPINEFANLVISSIAGILEHLRAYFSGYFDYDAALPSHFLQTYKAACPLFNGALESRLTRYEIDFDLAKLIYHFSDSSNRSERFKIKTWRQWDYLLRMIKEMIYTLDHHVSGELNLELLKLFIARDFNSVQVYGYFVKYMEKITLGEASFSGQQEDLIFMLKTFKQVRTEGMSYDPKVQSLKSSVVESLEAEIEYIQQKEKLLLQSHSAINPQTTSKFYFKVAVILAELMFLFRVMIEVGFISTKFKSYLYEFISNHIQTDRAEHISKKSMRNHFNNKPFPERLVQNVKHWLEKMIQHIDLYYKS